MNFLYKQSFLDYMILIFVGSIVGFVLSKLTVSDLPPVCKDWNKNFIMEILYF